MVRDAEAYFAERMKDPEYAKAYESYGRVLSNMVLLLKSIDERRIELGMSKAELARRADLPPESVRRLFSQRGSNPTLHTILLLAEAADLEVKIRITPRGHRTRSRPRTA